MQHVALRLETKPYLDQHLWETILRKTDWITCLRLNHVRIAKELIPCQKDAQDHLDKAVASGNIKLVGRALQSFSGFPNLDIAAKADQFEMLKFLDGLDRAGTCICVATEKMAVYAALNSNLAMLGWLIEMRLEVNGDGVLAAAAGLGNIHLINWILEQDKTFSVANISLQAGDALSSALRAGHLKLALFLIERFSLQAMACVQASSDACLTVLQQLLLVYSDRMDSNCWSAAIAQALTRDDVDILSLILDRMRKVRGSLCSESYLVEMAARSSSVRLMAVLVAAMPNELEKTNVTKAAMQGAINRGHLEMVLSANPPSYSTLYPLYLDAITCIICHVLMQMY